MERALKEPTGLLSAPLAFGKLPLLDQLFYMRHSHLPPLRGHRLRAAKETATRRSLSAPALPMLLTVTVQPGSLLQGGDPNPFQGEVSVFVGWGRPGESQSAGRRRSSPAERDILCTVGNVV